jgi:Ca2+-binding EF-hand superfamily protein
MFPTEAELADMINEVDPNRKGKLEFSEFLSLIVKRAPDADP